MSLVMNLSENNNENVANNNRNSSRKTIKKEKHKSKKIYYEKLVSTLCEIQKKASDIENRRMMANNSSSMAKTIKRVLFSLFISVGCSLLVVSIFQKKNNMSKNLDRSDSSIFEIIDAESFKNLKVYHNIGILNNLQEYIVDLREKILKGENHFNNCEKFILLSGKPGTGKSYFSKVLAGSISKKMKTGFISVQPSDFMSKFYGESEQNIRNLFNTIKNNKNKYDVLLIFFDEINYIIKKPGSSLSNLSDLHDTLRSEFLTLMDGTTGKYNDIPFMFIGTMNMIFSNIDPPFYRRFRQKYTFENLDPQDVKETLRLFSKDNNINFFNDIDEAEITREFMGKSIDSLMNCLKKVATEHHKEVDRKSDEEIKKLFFEKFIQESQSNNIKTNKNYK